MILNHIYLVENAAEKELRRTENECWWLPLKKNGVA